jgi:hypothetical protein
MIHKTPKVGCFICTESPYYYGMFVRGGIITKINGKRIYYNPLRMSIEDHTSVLKDEHGNPVISDFCFEEYKIKFSAICDTIEEYESLLKFQEECRVEFNDLLKNQQVRASEFFKEK